MRDLTGGPDPIDRRAGMGELEMDSVPAVVAVLREELRRNRETLPRISTGFDPDVYHRLRLDMEAQEQAFTEYMHRFGALGRIDDYLDQLAHARATGHAIRTILGTTDPGVKSTGASSDPGRPAPLASFKTRHWIALAALTATTLILLAARS